MDDCRHLVRLAVREDLDRFFDLTTVALVPETARGRGRLIVREAGVCAGLPAAQVVVEEMNLDASLRALCSDGAAVSGGCCLAEILGSARDLLTAERLILNLLGRLSGIATLTRQFVDRIAGTRARIYDTRKTTPAWRRLEKYAVRCGGGYNHRTGLFDALLIKDNHLAQGSDAGLSPAAAVRKARRFLAAGGSGRGDTLVEVEVDTWEQFEEALGSGPDIILLDNMPPEQLREAVRRRDAAGAAVELEASGGVRLATVRAIAETGVDRISVGALTHSAVTLDVGLDWVAP